MLLTHTALALVPSRTARKTFLHAYRMHALLQYQRFGVMRSVVGMFRQIGPLTDAVSASYILPTALSIPLCQLNAARETGLLHVIGPFTRLNTAVETKPAENLPPSRAAMLDVPISELRDLRNLLKGSEDTSHEEKLAQALQDPGLQTGFVSNGSLDCRGGCTRLFYTEYAMDVKCKVSIRGPADIKIATGNMERVAVKMVTWDEGVDAFDPDTFATSSGAPALEDLALRVGDPELDQQSMASLVQTCPPVKAELQLEVPERYCSLDITSCGGSVSIAGVNEASLAVCALPCGDVHLGKVKASSAECHAAGGKLSAGLLVAEHINASGATVEIRRLMTRRGAVAQGHRDGAPTGSLMITAAYTEGPVTFSSEGDTSIGTLSSTPGVATVKCSGSVAIECLDGRACVESADNSSVTIHAQDNLEFLHLTGDSRTTLVLSPELAKTVKCKIPPEVLNGSLPPGVQTLDDASFDKIRDNMKMSTPEPPSFPALGVSALPGGGTVSVSIESWIDSIRRRKT